MAAPEGYSPVVPAGGFKKWFGDIWARLTDLDTRTEILEADALFNPRTYGAVGNGAADDTVAIQAAVDACSAAGGGTVLMPPGVYRTTNTIALKSNVTLRGHGAGVTTILYAGVTNQVIRLNAGGTGAQVATLTANANRNDQTITVSSTAGITAGTWLLLRDNSIPEAEKPTRIAGELIYVSTVDSGTQITVRTAKAGTGSGGVRGTLSPTPSTSLTGWGPYTVANSANLYDPGAWSVNAHLRDLTVATSTQGTGNVMGYQLQWTRDCTITGVEFRNIDGTAVTVGPGVGLRVVNCTFRDLTDDSINDQFGYGVNLGGAVHGVMISGCRFERLRHSVTTNGSDIGGVPSMITVSDCQAYQTSNASFDTHGAGADIWFSNCTSFDSNTWGFNARANHVTFTDCEAIRPRLEGFLISQVAKPYGTKIIRCTVRDGGASGIAPEGGYHTRIVGLLVDGTQLHGARAGYGANDLKISNSVFANYGQNGGAASGIAWADTGSGTVTTTGYTVVGCFFRKDKTYTKGTSANIALPADISGAVVNGNRSYGLPAETLVGTASVGLLASDNYRIEDGAPFAAPIVVTTLPTANATNRGRIVMLQAAGVQDTVHACVRNAAGTGYLWVAL